MKFSIKNILYSKIVLINLLYTFYIQSIASRKIVLIQNAEPDEHEMSKLSAKGEARSICLNELIEKQENLKPQIIYAQNPNGDVYTPLPLQTVNHLAAKLNIEINDSFKERQQAKLASTIENLPDEIETVLLCWNRYQIELLVKTLGIDDPPVWSDGYDNLWIVENDNLIDTTQNLNSCIEREKANLISGASSLLYYGNNKSFIVSLLLFSLSFFMTILY
ncbi:hypothetical protein H8356DRAFT_1302194 [Neocallimastix lanati (nom. inval.)]|uniref:Uncharacterized protein n=1 Tax=Neocallimastix californiae TaxID=1754190 RepID=A0A1Y2DKX4_9FUNG|nr:hypothetical protein H8356DRAFT_1302194 [Neocallimastix sp. JGI-2020a]ORY59861.1 hypothetical protein LY90DRAFT_643536 [Neocallimastix californiae]|eukprot:ORY59861.1 hypothetical protein LY90DRAFT_643536 [Neocallimastix californiae]